ncbi:PepSY domain-containing protein [Ensifer sp. 4252]|uniref:PepSY domain-containing protein n=1 Tax=Ensifer sp. 4252 TaxID=3373915 RepID=UPI003D2318B0
MKRTIAATAFLAASAFAVYAQTATTSPDPETPAVATPDTTNPTAPVQGANSFTEEQARARLEENGYTSVTGLKLDDKGIWQASATKDGKPVTVTLDYQGNIVAN